MGWFILNKYYNLTDDCPVYAAALLLDPRKRTAYIRKNWAPDWLNSTIASASTIWEAEYKTAVLDVNPVDPDDDSMTVEPSNVLQDLMDELDVVIEDSDADDFNTWILDRPIPLRKKTKTEKGESPLDWWCSSTQREQYPRLSRMAIGVLSVPAESAEAERTFSGARRTCSWDRLRLTCKNIERIELIGNWLRGGLIQRHTDRIGDETGEIEAQAAQDWLQQVEDDIDSFIWD